MGSGGWSVGVRRRDLRFGFYSPWSNKRWVQDHCSSRTTTTLRTIDLKPHNKRENKTNHHNYTIANRTISELLSASRVFFTSA